MIQYIPVHYIVYNNRFINATTFSTEQIECSARNICSSIDMHTVVWNEKDKLGWPKEEHIPRGLQSFTSALECI